MSAAVADDYAPREEDTDASSPPRSVGSKSAALVVAAGIGILVTGLLISTLLSADVRQRTRGELVDRVTAANAIVTARQAEVNDLQTGVEAVEARLVAAGDLAPGVAERRTGLATAAGTSELSGTGVRIVVDDAPGADAGSEKRVLDRDLQDIVNALWREGAKGIAINGSRLVSTTAIRAAGEAIVVNFQPLERPYVIEAVGAGVAAQEASGAGRLLAHLTRDYGLVTGATTADVTLPAGEVHEPRFATRMDAAGGGGQP